MGEQEGGAKELFQLILHKPALLITVLAGGGLLVFLLVRNQGGSTTTSSTGTSGVNQSTSPDYNAYQSGYDIGYTRGAYSVPTPATSASNLTNNTPPDSTSPIPPSTTTVTTTTIPTPTVTTGLTNPDNKVATPPPTVATPPPANTYTIMSGDTLSGIAARLGTTWQALYQGNKQTIDTTSTKYGNPVPGGPQNNIFPGEVLTY